MSVESLIGDVEAALVRLINLGLGWRYSAASVSAMAALNAAVLRDAALCYATDAGLYEWSAWSTATADGSSVVASTSLPSGKTNGRWLKVVTDWAFGAGGVNLAAKSTGYLQAVEAYSSDDGVDVAIERVFGQTPSVLVQFQGDSPTSNSNLPGTFYKNPLEFQLLIITSNLRGKTSATQGSPVAAEAAADPGAYAIIGQLRRLLCGVSPAFGIAGVERVEIGPAALAFEDSERRLFVWTLGVTVRASFDIEDEDLVDAAVRVQPALTEQWPSTIWDKKNYVASGGGLDEGAGAGFSRTISETLAKVSGLAATIAATPVTFTPDTDTYRDFAVSGWTLTAIDVGADPPPVAGSSFRVAVTRTDGSGIVYDRALCSFSIAFGDAFDVVP